MIHNIEELFNFLRIDADRVELKKLDVSLDDDGVRVVNMEYFDLKTKQFKKCVIGVNGAKINEFAQATR